MTPDSFTPEEREKAQEAINEISEWSHEDQAHLYVPVESAIDLQCELTRERGRREQAEELLREADEWLRLAGFIPQELRWLCLLLFLAV